jgi:hypothetical protein
MADTTVQVIQTTAAVVQVVAAGPQGPAGGGGGGAVDSVFGRTGAVVATVGDYTAAQVGAAATVHTHADGTTTVAGFISTADKTKLDGIAAGAEVNVNADWNAVSGDAAISNKPTLGTAAAADLGTGATNAAYGNHTHSGVYEPAQTVASQAEMEAGTEAAIRSVTPARVKQAIVYNSTVDLTDSADLALSHQGKILTLNKGTAATLTIRKNSVTAYPVGFTCLWVATGAGQWTFTASSGDGTVVLNVRGAATKTAGQYAMGSLVQVATDVWVNSGDLTT